MVATECQAVYITLMSFSSNENSEKGVGGSMASEDTPRVKLNNPL